MDIREQRVSFVVTASRGEKPFRALCQEFGISRPTGYLWLSRFREGGVSSIAERSRRPAVSPERTAPELESQVVALRQRYPDWGARKLEVLLRGSAASNWHAVRSTASCCGTGGWVAAIMPVRRHSVLSARHPTNCGRWTSRGHCRGAIASVRCRSSTTTAVTCWL